MRRPSNAFTLVELLLASGLVALMSVGIFTAFVNGARLWERVAAVSRSLEIAIFLDRWGEDLRKSMPISGIGAKGISSRFSFPTIVYTRADAHGRHAFDEWVHQIGAVQYYYEPETKTIYRRQANYSQALKGQWGPPAPQVQGIEEMEVRYYTHQIGQARYQSQLDGHWPTGVRVTVTTGEGETAQRWQKFLPTMAGGGS
jgi:type II secretory pathway component PulJ